MANKATKGKVVRAGKAAAAAAAPPSAARVERRKKAGRKGAANEPKTAKGSAGTGGRRGGLH